MNYMKPAGAPPCWGQKYQDGEPECMQCRYQVECKQEVLHKVVSTPSPSLPVIRNYAPTPYPQQQRPAPSATIVPLPPKPYFAPPVNSIPTPKVVTPLQPTGSQQQQQQTTYYQSSSGYTLPNPAAPNPFASWHRPGAVAPAYHFTQYPGENVSLRLIKNALLRALEAIFAELMQFFRHWTWPSKL